MGPFYQLGVNTVPKVLGLKSLPQVNSAIQWARLVPEREPDIVVSDSIDGGKVIRQDPGAGALVVPGTVVRYAFGRWGSADQ